MVWETVLSTSARLPPTWRCSRMAMTVQLKSTLLVRLAMASKASSSGRPSRASVSTRWNSPAIGSPASWTTVSTACWRLCPACRAPDSSCRVLGSCSSNLAWRRDARTDRYRNGPTVPSRTTMPAMSRFRVMIRTRNGGMNADPSEMSTNSATRMLSPADSSRSRNVSSRLPRRTRVSAMAVARPAHSLEPKAVSRGWSSAIAGVSEYGDNRCRNARYGLALRDPGPNSTRHASSTVANPAIAITYRPCGVSNLESPGTGASPTDLGKVVAGGLTCPSSGNRGMVNSSVAVGVVTRSRNDTSVPRPDGRGRSTTYWDASDWRMDDSCRSRPSALATSYAVPLVPCASRLRACGSCSPPGRLTVWTRTFAFLAEAIAWLRLVAEPSSLPSETTTRLRWPGWLASSLDAWTTASLRAVLPLTVRPAMDVRTCW